MKILHMLFTLGWTPQVLAALDDDLRAEMLAITEGQFNAEYPETITYWNRYVADASHLRFEYLQKCLQKWQGEGWV